MPLKPIRKIRFSALWKLILSELAEPIVVSGILSVHCFVWVRADFCIWYTFCPLFCMITSRLLYLVYFLSVVLYDYEPIVVSGILSVRCFVWLRADCCIWYTFCLLFCMITSHLLYLVYFLSVVLYDYEPIVVSCIVSVRCFVWLRADCCIWYTFCPLFCMSTSQLLYLVYFLSIVLYEYEPIFVSGILSVHCFVWVRADCCIWYTFCPLFCMITILGLLSGWKSKNERLSLWIIFLSGNEIEYYIFYSW
jgi:hypothetical protein